VVLDPFCGSGSTVAAAVRAGFSAVGIDQSDEYVEIARRRVEYWITAGV
jgi:DNA modification methylase